MFDDDDLVQTYLTVFTVSAKVPETHIVTDHVDIKPELLIC